MYLNSNSSGMQDEGTASLLSNEKVDVWTVNPHHTDIRMEEQLFNELRDTLPGCSVLHSSVESLVRDFEQGMMNAPQEDWHQSYVSYSVPVYTKRIVILYDLSFLIIFGSNTCKYVGVSKC